MYCRKCGKQIDDEAVVCPHCGVLAVRNGTPRFYGKPAQPVQYYTPVIQPVVQPVQQPAQPVQITEQAPAEPKGTNGLGLAGFVIGLLSLITGMYFCISAVIGLIFSIFGVMNRKKYKSCNGLAIAGVVLSAVALVGWFAFFASIFINMIIFY